MCRLFIVNILRAMGGGGGTSDLHRLSRNGKGRRSRKRLVFGKQQVATRNFGHSDQDLLEIRFLFAFLSYSDV